MTKFSDLKVQSDLKVDDKVKGNLLLLTSDILLLPSDFFHLTSYILLLFEHPPSPSTLKGLHLSLVFSPLRGKKTAPPVALTLR